MEKIGVRLAEVLFALQPEMVRSAAAEKTKWRQRWIWWVLFVFPIGFASAVPVAICLWQKASGPVSTLALIVAVVFDALMLALGQRIYVRKIVAQARSEFAWQTAKPWVSWYFALIDVSYALGQKLLVFVDRKSGVVFSFLVRDDKEGLTALRYFLMRYQITAGDALAVEVKAEFSNPLLVDGNYWDLLDFIQGRVGIALSGARSTPKELVAAATRFIHDSALIGASW